MTIRFWKKNHKSAQKLQQEIAATQAQIATAEQLLQAQVEKMNKKYGDVTVAIILANQLLKAHASHQNVSGAACRDSQASIN